MIQSNLKSKRSSLAKWLFSLLLSCSLAAPAAVLLESDGHDHGDNDVHSYYATQEDAPPIVSNAEFLPGAWPSSTITYSFMATGTSTSNEDTFIAPDVHGATFTALGDFMPAGWKAEIEAAFAAWEAVAGLTFIEVPDDNVPWNASPTTGHGDIRIGGAPFDGAGSTLAHAFNPPNGSGTAWGDMHFDMDETWKIGFGGGGFDIFQVAAHEIGHSIGLDHTAVPGSLMNPFYTEAFSGPQADDIAGAQFLYGAPLESAVVPEPSTGLLFAFAMVLLLRMRNLTPEELTRVLSFAGVPSAPAPVPVRREWKRLRKSKESASRGY